MNGQQLFDYTAGIMGITPSNATSYSETVISQINAVLADTFNLENNQREYLNQTLVTPLALLTSIPVITSLTDALTYQDGVLRKVCSWGLAELFALSDDDTIKTGYFNARYNDAKNLEAKLINTDIVDFYSTEEDE
jgi:hypothetical protein